MIKVLIAIACASGVAYADELTVKDQCVDAHGRGQDAKAEGHLTLAKKLFLSCAQAACPAIVQNDCARFADELTRAQPSLSFAARDGTGADLPDTTVYVDGQLVATRLDDGKPHEVDPGKHVVRFTSGGRDEIVTVVVGTGEQGRAVVATFGASARPVPRPIPRVSTTHAAGARVAIAAGLGLVAIGTVVGVWGMTQVPSGCSIGTHQCTAPPGDPAFAQASHGMKVLDVGLIAGGVGIMAVAGGLAWYMSSAKTIHEGDRIVMPWVTPEGGGLAIAGPL